MIATTYPTTTTMITVRWRSQRGGGHGGHAPKLLVNVFSPINLRSYVILVCK